MLGLPRFARSQQVLQPRLVAAIGTELSSATCLGWRQEHNQASRGPGTDPSSSGRHAEGGHDDGSRDQRRHNRPRRSIRPQEAFDARRGNHRLQGDSHDGSREQGRSGGELFPASISNVSRCLTRQDIVDFFKDYGLTPDQVR